MKKQLLVASLFVMPMVYADYSSTFEQAAKTWEKNQREAMQGQLKQLQELSSMLEPIVQAAELQQQRLEILLLLSLCQHDKSLSEAEQAQCTKLREQLSQFLTDAADATRSRTIWGAGLKEFKRGLDQGVQALQKSEQEADDIDDIDFGNDRED